MGRAPAFVIDWLDALARQQMDRQIMVRLVKGAYWDTEIKRAQTLGLSGYPVFTRKVNTDVSYVACARKLLSVGDRIYPQFATHNAHTVAAVLAMAANRDNFEFQRLHGMGEHRRTRRARSTPIVCSSSQPLATFGTTSTTSGPLGSRRRAASASATHAGRHVLVLEVDRAARRADGVQVEGRDLAALGRLADGGQRPREARVYAAEIGLELLRPGIRARPRGRDAFARRGAPTLASEPAERTRRGAVERDADVVEGCVVREPRVVAPLVAGPVLARVPAAGGEVEASREGDGVVDDHELLVMAAAGRMEPVEREPQPGMRPPPEPYARQHLALEREEHREVPLEHVDLEVAPPSHEPVEERHEIASVTVAAKPHAGVEVPPDQEHPLARAFERVGDRAEVALPVDEKGRTVCRLDPPAVASRGEEPRRRVVVGDRERPHEGRRGARPVPPRSRPKRASSRCRFYNGGRKNLQEPRAPTS